MERLVYILLLTLLIQGCSSNPVEKTRQIYYSNSGDTVSIYSKENVDILFVKGPNGNGQCELINEPQPMIQDIINDTIIIQYDYMHNVYNRDTLLLGYIKQVNSNEDCKYVVKAYYNYFYNGNSIGSIDGITWDYNYSYFIDDVVHDRDTISFYRGTDLLFKANQRFVCYDNKNEIWEVYYLDSNKRDDNMVYKMQKCIRFIRRE
jgi:hypothetical protein